MNVLANIKKSLTAKFIINKLADVCNDLHLKNITKELCYFITSVIHLFIIHMLGTLYQFTVTRICKMLIYTTMGCRSNKIINQNRCIDHQIFFLNK